MRRNIFSKLMCVFLLCTLFIGQVGDLGARAYANEDVTYIYVQSTGIAEGSDGSQYYVGSSTDGYSCPVKIIKLPTTQRTLAIPVGLENVYYESGSKWNAVLNITSIASDAFSDCNNLKYVKLEMAASDFNKIASGALDFSSAENLETVYVNCDANYTYNGTTIKEKFKLGNNSSVEILQYMDLSSKSLYISESKYEGGKVEISFDDIIGRNGGAYGYKVIRSLGENEEPVIFDSNDEALQVKFSIENGEVTFTDDSVEVGNTYNYVITAYNLFGSSTSNNTEVVVPLPDISTRVVELEQDVYTYTGKAIEPEVIIEGVDESYYSVEYSDNVNVGTATVTITGQVKYTGIIEKTFKIERANINNKTVVLENDSYEYDGNAKTPSVKIEGLKADDYTVEYSNNVNPGTATVTITGKGNCQGTITKTFVIKSVKQEEDDKGKPVTDPIVPSVVKPEVKPQKTVMARLATGKGAYDDIYVKWSSQSVKGATVKYKVEYRVTGGKWKNALKSAYTTKTSLKKKNLVEGKKYCFRVTPCVEIKGILYKGKAKTSGYVYTLKKLKKPGIKKISGNKIKLTWKDINGETGYQIAKSSYKNKKFKVIKNIKNAKAKSVTLKVNKNKKYYYKVRAYKIVNKKKVYGPWSEVKAFKLK
ncbi:MAG: fibronectin type III domain-containing protein [Lachnospiraceae bacterium]|nr:fibronectin type III domain-containing protein [Lachnospiraceae bacterium]